MTVRLSRLIERTISLAAHPAARSLRMASTPYAGHVDVEDGEIRIQRRDGFERRQSVGASASTRIPWAAHKAAKPSRTMA